MSIKKICIAVFIFSVVRNIFCEEIITILKPTLNSTSSKEQFVEGKVELPLIKNIQISVEPFIWDETKKIQIPQTVSVVNGYFKENITLSPGLNLIKISSLGGKHKIVKPVFLVSDRPSLLKPVDSWGKHSDIIFTAPREIKSITREIVVKGIVTDASIKSVEVIDLDTISFLTETGGIENGRIDYREVKIKDLQFNFTLKLKQGLNILVARPSEKKSNETNLQIKSIIYEKTSEKIVVEEPVLENGKLTIKGKVNDITIKKVRLNIHSLVEQEIHPGKILPKTILDKCIDVKSDGSFYLKTGLIREGYSIKSPPIITVTADGEIVTKTIIKWW